jgi:hypothetical protein
MSAPLAPLADADWSLLAPALAPVPPPPLRASWALEHIAWDPLALVRPCVRTPTHPPGSAR